MDPRCDSAAAIRGGAPHTFMAELNTSLTKKLTRMNLLVSGAAVLLATTLFLIFELISFRTGLIVNRNIEADIVAANVAKPLILNDPKLAESTLAALQASQHVVYAGVYRADGEFFAGYWRDAEKPAFAVPAFATGKHDFHWFERGYFGLVDQIEFEGKRVGVVYIRSDLNSLKDRLRNYFLLLAVTLSGALIVVLAVSRRSQRVVSRPILQLAEVARFVSREKNYQLRAPRSDDQDEIGVLVEAFNDMLGEIQKRESALQDSEQQFRTLADSIPQLAWMAEPDGDLFWCNHRWYEYTGKTASQVRGWGWQMVHDPEILPKVIEKWRASLSSGEPFEMVFPLRGADGAYREFLTLASPVRDAHGNIVRWFGTNTDVTDQRRSEEALRRSEKLAATGRLAASIAHEINNPLEAVTNLVYLARKQPANVQKYLTLADQELDRIAQITKNTLGFYRDSVSASEVDISKVLEEVLLLYARKMEFKNVRLTTDFAMAVKVTGFPGEIRQIFANLISNAIEAVPEQGCLRIRASAVGSAGGARPSGVRVTFLDNGPGIRAGRSLKDLRAVLHH